MLITEQFEHTIDYIAEHGISSIGLIGFIGPLLTSCITTINLLYLPKYLFTFIIFFAINIGVNRMLKLWLRQSRPSGGKSILGEVYQGADEYGMPSAHAQILFYSVVYLYFVKENIEWLSVGLGIGALTLYQRWSYRRHTISQLLVGIFIGSIIAYIATLTAKYWITDGYFW